MGFEAVSETLAEECTAEFTAGLNASPRELERHAARWLGSARELREPPRAANDPLSDCAWTLSDRLARAFAIEISERPKSRATAGQYGGAIVRRRACWIIEGLPAPLRELLGVHECVHVLAGPLALSEGAVWWATLAMIYPGTAARSAGDMYLTATLAFPAWTAARRWHCLEMLRAAELDEAG